jgi:hypothetical protein
MMELIIQELKKKKERWEKNNKKYEVQEPQNVQSANKSSGVTL